MSTTPIVKVRDMAYPRLQVPDLDQMEAYLMDFGMVRAERRADVLFMRGAGTAPYVHVIHEGPAAFTGFALEAGSREDLERLAAEPGFPRLRTSMDLAGVFARRCVTPLACWSRSSTGSPRASPAAAWIRAL